MSALPMLDEDEAPPLLSARNVTVAYGTRIGCREVSFDLWPGEVLGIVGESGSGKTSLLGALSARLEPAEGQVLYRQRDGEIADIYRLSEPRRRLLMRTDWGFVHQN